MKKIQMESSQGRKNLIKFIAIGSFAIVLVFVLEVWVANRLSTYGSKLDNIRQAQESLQLQNQVLANQIAEKSSYLNVEKQARQLGFAPIKNIEYVKPANLASTFK